MTPPRDQEDARELEETQQTERQVVPQVSFVKVRVEAATEVTAELIEAIAALVPQLSSSSPAPGPAELAEIVESPVTTLLVARSRRRRHLDTGDVPHPHRDAGVDRGRGGRRRRPRAGRRRGPQRGGHPA